MLSAALWPAHARSEASVGTQRSLDKAQGIATKCAAHHCHAGPSRAQYSLRLLVFTGKPVDDIAYPILEIFLRKME